MLGTINDINEADIGMSFVNYIIEGDVKHIKRLLNGYDVNVNSCLPDGQRPLYVAALNGQYDVVKTLLNYEGIRVNAVGVGNSAIFSRTALHAAVRSGNIDVVKLFTSVANIDVDAEDDYGITPLMLASQFGILDAVVVLIEAGADINAVNVSGKTSMNIARMKRHHRIVQILENALKGISISNNKTMCAYNDTDYNNDNYNNDDDDDDDDDDDNNDDNDDNSSKKPFSYWPRYMYSFMPCESFSHMVFNCSEINIDETNQFFCACGDGDVSSVLILLQAGVHADMVRSCDGYTPLCIAAYYEQTEVIDILTKAGANPNIRNKEGLTPLGIAAKMNFISVISMFLKANANVDLAVFREAAEHGRTDVVRTLLRYFRNNNRTWDGLDFDLRFTNPEVVALLRVAEIPLNYRGVHSADVEVLLAAHENVPRACFFCFATSNTVGTTIERCAGCLRVRYCSIECQQKAWPDHKHICKATRIRNEKTSREVELMD